MDGLIVLVGVEGAGAGLVVENASKGSDGFGIFRKLFLGAALLDIQDAAEADETFSILMGDKVEPRREFIEQNAKYVQNLDV